MKTSGAVLAGVLLAACGSDAGSPGTPGVDFTCDATTQRIGTYLVHYDEHAGGTCGPLTDSLIRWTSDGASTEPGTTCQLTEPPTITDRGCTVQNTVQCADVSGAVMTGTGSSTQEDARGAKIGGIFSTTLRDQAGDVTCESLYDVTYTRQ